MKRSAKSAVSILLLLAVILSTIPVALNTYAVSGSQYTANQYIAGRLDLVLSEYPIGSYFSFDGKPCDHHGTNTCSYIGNCNCRSNFVDSETGKTIKLNSIQCMGFAHYVFYRLFGFIDRAEYDSSLYYSLGSLTEEEMTAENCRNLLLKASTGAHIRVEGHSMIYLSGNNDGLTVLHCNADAKCGISIKYWTWSGFAQNFKTREIIRVNMPKNYPHTTAKSVIDTSKPYYYSNDDIVFNWTPKTGVSNYKIKITSCTDSKKIKEYSSIVGITKTVSDSSYFVAGNTYRADIYAGGATSADSSVYFYIAKNHDPLGQTVKNGIYSLKNVKNGRFLTSPSSVSTASFNNGINQLYYFEYIGDGLYKIHVGGLDSTKLLTVNSSSLGVVANNSSFTVQEADKAKTNRQLFYVSKASNGYYIESIGNTDYVMNGSSGTGVTVNPESQSTHAVWSFCDSKGAVIDASKVSAFVVGNYTITTESTSLNVRKGPGTNYDRVGSVAKGATVTVTAVDGVWGYTTSSEKPGWICLEGYTTFASPLVTSISVASQPKKTVYTVKEKLDTTGLSIKAIYSDGSTKTVSNGFVCSYDFSTAGDSSNGYKKSVVVSYLSKTTSFSVTVTGSGMPTVVLTDLYSVNTSLKTISGIAPGQSLEEFLGGFHNHNYIKVYNGNNEISSSTKVATGMTLKLTDGKTVAQTLTVVVTGDANGDGAADVSDILTIQSYILKKSTLNDTKLRAADCNGDGAADVSDILTIQSHILGKSSIKVQKF